MLRAGLSAEHLPHAEVEVNPKRAPSLLSSSFSSCAMCTVATKVVTSLARGALMALGVVPHVIGDG